LLEVAGQKMELIELLRQNVCVHPPAIRFSHDVKDVLNAGFAHHPMPVMNLVALKREGIFEMLS